MALPVRQRHAAGKKGEPALAKLLLLPKLQAQVKKRDLQEKLLEVGLLMSIKRWLEPLPDRSFPNSTLGLAEGLLSFCLPQFSFLWRIPIRGTHSSAE